MTSLYIVNCYGYPEFSNNFPSDGESRISIVVLGCNQAKRGLTIVSLLTYFAGSVASNWMDLFSNGKCKKIRKVQSFHEDCR